MSQGLTLARLHRRRSRCRLVPAHRERDTATTFVGPSSARVIHEDLAHQPRGKRAEMRTTVDGHAVEINEVQVSFVDERGRLQ